jgi:hypothetical protein
MSGVSSASEPFQHGSMRRFRALASGSVSGEASGRCLRVAWICIGLLIAADALWLPFSSLRFPASNWVYLAKVAAVCGMIFLILHVAALRLAGDNSAFAKVLKFAIVRTELICFALVPVTALLVAGVTFSYLSTAAALPLQDALLVRLDAAVGFVWPDFLAWTNDRPMIVRLLCEAYNSIGIVAGAVLVWLAVTLNKDRLADFIAVLSVTVVLLAISMTLIPAAGAFAYHAPAPQVFANFGRPDQMWIFSPSFMAARNGVMHDIDLTMSSGIVSFPSFHTILGIITIYALRDTRGLMACVAILNGVMIVSTLPVGGHHLMDVLAAAVISLIAILIVRRTARTSAA